MKKVIVPISSVTTLNSPYSLKNNRFVHDCISYDSDGNPISDANDPIITLAKKLEEAERALANKDNSIRSLQVELEEMNVSSDDKVRKIIERMKELGQALPMPQKGKKSGYGYGWSQPEPPAEEGEEIGTP